MQLPAGPQDVPRARDNHIGHTPNGRREKLFEPVPFANGARAQGPNRSAKGIFSPVKSFGQQNFTGHSVHGANNRTRPPHRRMWGGRQTASPALTPMMMLPQG
jgi:hypothetical protein